MDRNAATSKSPTALENLVQATLIAAGRSPHTQRAYQFAIALFLLFLEKRIADDVPHEWHPFAVSRQNGRRVEWSFQVPLDVLHRVDANTIEAFQRWRAEQGDGVNAVMLRLAAIRTFLSVAYRERALTHEQAQQLGVRPYRSKHQRDIQPVGRRLTPSEVRQLFAACNTTTNKGKRDRAILEVMLYLGLRRDEVCGLRLENFRQEKGHWWVVLQGKGKHTRRIKVHPLLLDAIEKWLSTASRTFTETGVVFTSITKGDRITMRALDPSAIGRLVADYGASAGLAPRTGTNRLAPHDLRRTCARNAYDNGADLFKVQQLLGHADPKTTIRYIGVLDDDSDTAIDHLHY